MALAFVPFGEDELDTRLIKSRYGECHVSCENGREPYQEIQERDSKKGEDTTGEKEKSRKAEKQKRTEWEEEGQAR